MIFGFAELELDSELCELRRQDGAIRLQPRAFDVLLYLVQQRHRVVTKDELLSTIWRDCHVSEGALTQVIKTIRHTLLANSVDAELIVTVRGRGFRFNEPVVTVARQQPLQRRPQREGSFECTKHGGDRFRFCSASRAQPSSAQFGTDEAEPDHHDSREVVPGHWHEACRPPLQ